MVGIQHQLEPRALDRIDHLQRIVQIREKRPLAGTTLVHRLQCECYLLTFGRFGQLGQSCPHQSTSVVVRVTGAGSRINNEATGLQRPGHLDRIHGVGLDSAERGHPPAKFREVFARARAAGLPTVAHAGEEGPPAYIRDALDLLGVVRIDHGVRCEEDPNLIARLRIEQVPLTVCPLSNVRLRVFDTLAEHNLGRLLDAGLLITVNSDDPAYFGGYLSANYIQTQRALGLEEADMVRLARNGFAASLLPDAEKASHIAAVEAAWAAFSAAGRP
ncbi:MAG: adenosine deaminase family protein [Planctomycetales bacterium]|nr:adenosine deaminase family protein [Planctomycetales bacterium]